VNIGIFLQVIPGARMYAIVSRMFTLPMVIETTRMNYWESGMDLKLGADLYDSFKKYQSLLIEEFDKMAEEFRFEVVDARKSPDEIQEELRGKILPVLQNHKQAVGAGRIPA
jgi:thymidylate kinase